MDINSLLLNGTYILVLVFFISVLLNFILIKASHKLKLIDTPNERSMHTIPKPRAGGVAIFVSSLIGTALLNYPINIGIVIGFFLIFLLGLYDDYREIKARVKLIGITIIVTILYLYGIKINNLGVFLGNDLVITGVSSYLFFLFCSIGFINALNLIDGLDGLASIVSIIILTSFAYMGYKYDDVFLFFTPLVLILSILGFLVFNWYPSKIFMGDGGSFLLGFSIVILAIHSFEKEYLTPISILLIAALPILDTLIVMLKRILKRKNPFQADKTHIHHIILKQQNHNVKKTVLLISGMQLLFTYIGLGFKVRDDLIILVMYILLFIIFYNFLNSK